MAEPKESDAYLGSPDAGVLAIVIRSVLQKSICEPYFIEAAETTLIKLFYEVGADANFAQHSVKKGKSGDGVFNSWKESQILAATTSTTTNDDDDYDTKADLFHGGENELYVHSFANRHDAMLTRQS